MNFCKKCNYVLNITKKQLNEEDKNHYKIVSLESFLNYVKYNMTEANQTVEIKIDRESLKEKLLSKFKKNPEKIEELISNLLSGELVPIPTLPSPLILKNSVPPL